MLQKRLESDSGMCLWDLLTDAKFALRKRKAHESNRESVAIRRLSRMLAEDSGFVLQELVHTAVEFCGADSAGISLEEPETNSFRWVAVAGSFSRYLDGKTPRNFSPCGTCLDSGRAQLYRVTKPYYDFLGILAEPIYDGILIPWTNEFVRGTLWAVSHASEEAFDFEDYSLLRSLADLVSIILRHQHHQHLMREGDKIRAAAEMADTLAHHINNPLQSLTNTIFLARSDKENCEAYLAQAESELRRLADQVSSILTQSFNPQISRHREESSPKRPFLCRE